MLGVGNVFAGSALVCSRAAESDLGADSVSALSNGAKELAKRSRNAYATVPFIHNVVDLMQSEASAFLSFQASHCWESVGIYIRLYNDLVEFYKNNPESVLKKYREVGGRLPVAQASHSGPSVGSRPQASSRPPPKALIAWLIACMMRNSVTRKYWLAKDRERQSKRAGKRRRKPRGTKTARRLDLGLSEIL